MPVAGVNADFPRPISYRQYKKLTLEQRGGAIKHRVDAAFGDERKKRARTLAYKRDFVKAEAARGRIVKPSQVHTDPRYNQIKQLLNTYNKPKQAKRRVLDAKTGKIVWQSYDEPAKLNQSALKRALSLLGRREGLPVNVRVGDSAIDHRRDRVTGKWSKKT